MEMGPYGPYVPHGAHCSHFNLRLISAKKEWNPRRSRHSHGYGYRLHNEYCTGSLISRQVVITAGHCIEGKQGSILMVNFLNRRKLILFRTVKKFHIYKQRLGDDIALLLLSKPINVCDAREPNVDERFGIIRLPLGNSFRSRWTDHDVEFSKCTMYGYGRSESELFECADFIASIEQLRIDYRLRSMRVHLKTKSPILIASLDDRRKICQART
ncbi:unnamed protein product [Dracunculus medinensis]|uniref:Peptidase S1 domain-containing protein n=1 Tax=Dracunculus medinensis TaxID=318479 RepID=A0A0N4UP55_DRAME|nr:unnamed protein product [Dracunculus medinensis]